MSGKKKKGKSSSKKLANTDKNIMALAMQEKIKIEKWLKGLNFTQRHYLELYAQEYYKRTQAPINEAMDCCISAALIQMFEELDYDEILEFQEFMLELIREHVEIDKGLKERGIDIMKNKKDLEPKVRVRVEELVKAGEKQSESIKILAIEFPTLSKASLTNAYKQVKQEIKDAEDLKETVKKETRKEVNKEVEVKLPFTEEEKEKINQDHIEAYEKIFNEPFEEISEREREIKEFVEKHNLKTELKVIKREVLAIGKYGEYIRDLEGVKVADLLFKSIEEVNQYEKIQIDKLRKRIEEIEGFAAESRDMFFVN